MHTFGEKLTLIRRHSGVSQEELASEIGVSRQTVSYWENDKIRPLSENIVALCAFFNVKPDYFLTDGVVQFAENTEVLPETSDFRETEVAVTAYAQVENVVSVHSVQSAANNLIYELKEEKPKKKSRKTAVLAALAVALTVAVLILSFFAYLYAPIEGASSSVSSSTWNFDDITTILELIAGVLAFAALCIAVYLVIRHFKNKKK